MFEDVALFHKICCFGCHFSKCIFAEGSFNQKPLALGENWWGNTGPIGANTGPVGDLWAEKLKNWIFGQKKIFCSIWRFRGFWRDRMERKNIAHRFGPRVSNFLSYRIVVFIKIDDFRHSWIFHGSPWKPMGTHGDPWGPHGRALMAGLSRPAPKKTSFGHPTQPHPTPKMHTIILQ